MTLVNLSASTTRSASPAASDESVRCHTASFHTLSLTSTVTVVADGELDAANAAQFADYALASTAAANALVVDLSSIEFCGTSGFSALHDINTRCLANGVEWSLIPSETMRRILSICDPDATLPVRERTIPKSPATDEVGPLLQLVPQTG